MNLFKSFLCLLTLMVVLIFIISDLRNVTIIIDNNIFKMNTKLDDDFYKKYNKWSYDTSLRTHYFGFFSNGNDYYFKVHNNKLIQLCVIKKEEGDFKMSIQVEKYFRNATELYNCKIDEISPYPLITEGLLIEKRIIENNVVLNIVDLNNIRSTHTVNPYYFQGLFNTLECE